MLTILIVDDEELVLKTLRNTIPWEENGFEIIGEASNVTEALKVYDATKPDIVITDVRMGESNGLSLVKELRERGEKVEIIILSGYNEFEYVQQALANKVVAYILKPFTNEEILNVLNDVKKNIETHKENARIIDNYIAQQENTTLMDIFNGNIPVAIVEAELEKLNIKIPKGNFMVSVIRIDKSGEEFSTSRNLSDIIDYMIGRNKCFILKHSINTNTIVLLMFVRDQHEISIADKLIEKIYDTHKNDNVGNIYIGVSGIFRNVSKLSVAYSQANQALESSLFCGSSKIVYYTDIVNSKSISPVLTIADFNEILQSVKTDGREANLILDKFFDNILTKPLVDTMDIKYTILDLYIFLTKAIIKDAVATEAIFGRRVHPMAEVWQLETINGIKVWIKDIVNALCDAKMFIVSDSYSNIVQRTVEYIMSNYYEQISVEEIANKLYVSAGHLMRVFKKETGKTFVEYLMEYRISIAKSLLMKGEYRIYEVANMVGYKDSKYFCRIYKKLTNTSPSNK